MSTPKQIAELLSAFTDQKIKKQIRELSIYYKTISQNLTDKTVTDYTEFVKYVLNNSDYIENISKTNINGLIFKSLNKELVKDQPTSNKVIKQAVFEIAEQLVKDILQIGSGKLRELENEKRSKQSSIMYSLQELGRFRQDIVKINLQIAALKKVDYTDVINKINEEIVKIINSNLFDYIYFDTSTCILHVIQRNECILHHEKTKYNLGKFSFNFNLQTNEFYILPFEGNIVTKYNNIHPFVFDYGGLCFGNATATFTECLKTYDLAKIFMLADCIMREYCDDNPVTSIYDFALENPKYHVTTAYPMTSQKMRDYFRMLEGKSPHTDDEENADEDDYTEYYKSGSYYNHKLCDEKYEILNINDSNHLGFKLSDLTIASKVA